MGWLNRLFNCTDMAKETFADKNTRSRPMEITFHYGDTTKYSKEEKIERVKTFITDSLNREPWHLKSDVRISPIDDDKCIISVDTLIDKDHPYSSPGYNKLRMELIHIFDHPSSSTYLPFIEKYGLDFYSKISRLVIKTELYDCFRLKKDAYIYLNSHHQSDFIKTIWDHVRSHFKDNTELSDRLKEIDYDRIQIGQDELISHGVKHFYMLFQILIDVDDTAILTQIDEVIAVITGAIYTQRNHPYIVTYTEGFKHHSTVLVESL